MVHFEEVDGLLYPRSLAPFSFRDIGTRSMASLPSSSSSLVHQLAACFVQDPLM